MVVKSDIRQFEQSFNLSSEFCLLHLHRLTSAAIPATTNIAANAPKKESTQFNCTPNFNMITAIGTETTDARHPA